MAHRKVFHRILPLDYFTNLEQSGILTPLLPPSEQRKSESAFVPRVLRVTREKTVVWIDISKMRASYGDRARNLFFRDSQTVAYAGSAGRGGEFTFFT